MTGTLYGVGVGSSFHTGDWFFGEVENAQARVEKFTDARVLREMDAMADAAGGPGPKAVQRFYHVPASNTAVGHLILENS